MCPTLQPYVPHPATLCIAGAPSAHGLTCATLDRPHWLALLVVHGLAARGPAPSARDPPGAQAAREAAMRQLLAEPSQLDGAAARAPPPSLTTTTTTTAPTARKKAFVPGLHTRFLVGRGFQPSPSALEPSSPGTLHPAPRTSTG